MSIGKLDLRVFSLLKVSNTFHQWAGIPFNNHHSPDMDTIPKKPFYFHFNINVCKKTEINTRNIEMKSKTLKHLRITYQGRGAIEIG